MLRRAPFRDLCHGVGPGDLCDALAVSRAAKQFFAHRTVDGEAPVNPAVALRNDRGASAIEFALTAPVFFMTLIGLIQCSLLLWAQFGLQHGVEMAARCASINTSLCG